MAGDIVNRLDVESDRVATAVLHHIDTIYPAMWSGVPHSARQSILRTIIVQVELELQRAAEIQEGPRE